MNILIYILLGAYFLYTILSIITVFREKRDIAATWAWLLVLILLPGIGFIFYLFIGKKMNREKIFDIKSQENIGMPELVQAQKQMLADDEGLLSDKQATENAKEMASLFLESDESILTKGNKVELFTDGEKKFDSLIEDISKVKICLDCPLVENTDPNDPNKNKKPVSIVN